MRIAFDHQIFCRQSYGGISRYIVEIANEMSSYNDVAIFSPVYVNEYLDNLSDKIMLSGIKVPRFPYTGSLYSHLGDILSPLMIRKFRPNIVHETYYSSHKSYPKDARIVITVHDMIHEILPQFFRSWDNTSQHKKTTILRADHIICVSENTKNDLMNFFDVKSEKITVVPHGFSFKKVTAHRNEFQININRPFILFVGDRSKYKNLYNFLKAFSSSRLLKEFNVVFFGGGYATDDDISLLRSLNIPRDCISFVSGDDDALQLHYKMASFFVYPSLYEGFGMPLLEAMSMGCPVACSNTSSIPEVVGAAALMFNPNDVDSIRNVMEIISSDSVVRETLVNEGARQIKKFSWQKSAAETLSVYRKII